MSYSKKREVLSFVLCNRMVLPQAKYRKVLLGTHAVHTLAQDLHMGHHQSFLSLLTAFLFLAREDTLSYLFTRITLVNPITLYPR